MQRANQTPYANSLTTKIDKCSQQCTLQSNQLSYSPSSNIKQSKENCNESKFNNKTSSVFNTDTYKEINSNSSFSKEINLFNNLIEKDELNNNLIESKDANNELVNRWSKISSIDQQSFNQINLNNEIDQLSPIYLHQLPTNDEKFNTNLIQNTKQIVNKNSIKLRSFNQLSSEFTSNQNDNQQSIHLHDNQIIESTANQMNLQPPLTAEQRISNRLKEKQSKLKCKLKSRLSSDSTSTESTKEDERLNKDLPFPEYVRYSFNWLPQDSEWRLICLRMIANPWFERVSMTAILINCITLGMYQIWKKEHNLRI